MTIQKVPLVTQNINNTVEIIEGYSKKIDDEETNGLLGAHNSTAYRIEELEKHFHNNEVWFGAGGIKDSLTPYTLVSDNNDFGTAVELLAPAGTPFVAGNVMFDVHRAIPIAIDTASLYLVRIIWDAVSVIAGEAARRYTTFPVYPTGVGSNVDGVISDVMCRRARSGTDYLWAKCKNATNLAELDLIFGIHEYLG